jgi:BirA family biotin operon repressor/biotin-[acetyl-CoA-carboxylase] ligase
MKTEQKILEMLKENPEDFVSGEVISEALNISRTMVWKHINALRDAGYRIESVKGKGYILKDIPDLLLPAEIEKGLKTEFVGRQILHFDTLASTNLRAKEIAADSPNGTVVVAEKQSDGRGRLGKAWASPPGGIYLSIILKPDIPPDHIHRLTLVAGVAAVETLSELGIDARIKWPNDILINEKKVCGILTEIDAEADAVNYVIIGIGVNANTELDLLPPLTMLQATSLKEEMGQSVDRIAITQRFLERFEQYYVTFSEGGFPSILKHWREHSSTIGRRVKLATKFRTILGEAVGIDHDGALIVELDDGTVEKEITGTCFHL